MEKVDRFSVSINKELIESFDKIIAEKGFKNRSNALQELIRRYVKEESEEIKKTHILHIYYNHKIVKDISDIENGYPCSVIASVNVHLDINNSLKVLTLFCSRSMKEKIEKKILEISGIQKVTSGDF